MSVIMDMVDQLLIIRNGLKIIYLLVVTGPDCICRMGYWSLGEIIIFVLYVNFAFCYSFI